MDNEIIVDRLVERYKVKMLKNNNFSKLFRNC